MSFKKKQLFGYGMILSLLLIFLTIVIVMLDNIKNNMSEIVNDRYYKVKIVNEFQRSFSYMDSELSYMINEPNNKDYQQQIQDYEINRQRAAVNLNQLQLKLNTERGKELLSKVQTNLDNYLNIGNQIIDQVKAGNKTAASNMIVVEAQSIRTQLNQATEDLKILQEQLMDTALSRSMETYYLMLSISIASFISCLVIGSGIALWAMKSTANSLRQITNVISNIDFSRDETFPRIPVQTKDEIGEIAVAFNEMAQSLEEHNLQEQAFNKKIEQQNWLKTRIAEMATMYQGLSDLESLGQAYITKIASVLEASYGVFYLRSGSGKKRKYVRLAAFAAPGGDVGAESFAIGEGLVGQCALENRTFLLSSVPEDYIKITSGLGQASPKSILIAPVEFEGTVVAVIELATLETFTSLQRELLEETLDTFGITINAIEGRMEIERLLKESQALTEELQAQSEELQSQSEEMQMQAEELRMINEQLEEQNQNAELKSQELEQAKSELEEKAKQLLMSSQYKSEFLANMSHELRTPLNSILIMSEMLAENRRKTLTDEEQELAQVIHTAGQDLLNLISDILDLSKVEAGKLDIVFEEVNIGELPVTMEQIFAPIAQQKGIDFTISKDPDVPDIFYTDEQRLQQIVKNLLSNAFKFTDKGSVTMNIRKADPSRLKAPFPIDQTDSMLEISITDTGIGIPKSKQKMIFDAFQQGDGAISRKYGGTGLGLSICREFSKLLGGYIVLQSEEGKGSTFTLYLPNWLGSPKKELVAAYAEAAADDMISALEYSADDTPKQSFSPATSIFQGKKVLVADDDTRNVHALTTALESQGITVLTAKNGRECLELLQQDPGVDLVLMDIMMPEMDGYEAMRLIRANAKLEHLPVIALTAKAMKNDREKCLEAGASDYISKPLKLNQLFSVMRVWLTK